tara:strand:- start:1121 stop:1495 length:375 start_codon:yes stop_codon:yes gene_type:complete
MKKVKSIFIDSENQEVSEVSIDMTNLDELCSLLKCNIVEIAWHSSDNKNLLFVDDEGLLKNTDKSQVFFSFKNAYSPIIAGNGVIVGQDVDDLEEISTTMSVEEIKNMVKFLKEEDIHNMFLRK